LLPEPCSRQSSLKKPDVHNEDDGAKQRSTARHVI
jgi:hypothetical protein